MVARNEHAIRAFGLTPPRRTLPGGLTCDARGLSDRGAHSPELVSSLDVLLRAGVLSLIPSSR